MIYIAVFCSAIVCTALAECTKHKKMTVLSIFFSLSAVLILSVFGGLRDETIGTDVLYYVKGNYNLAVSASSLRKYCTIVYAKEPLYLLLVYFVAKFFGNFQILLFVFQFITMACLYYALWRLRDCVSPWFVVLIYCALYYNDSFNIVRQHLAMVIVLLGCTFLIERKYKYNLICIVVATLIHFPAIVSIIFMLIYVYLQKKENKYSEKKRSIRGLILSLIALIGVLGIKIWCQFFIHIGILNSRYLYYFSHGSTSGHYLDTAIYGLEIVYMLVNSKLLMKRMKDFDFYKMIAIFNIIFLQLALFMNYGHRISMYFGIINMITIGKMPKTLYKISNRMITYFIVIGLVVFYWFRIYYFGGVSNTIPYIFYNH